MPPRKKAVPAEVRQPQASGDRSDTVVDENQPLEEPPVGDILKEIEERREAVLEAVKAHRSSSTNFQLEASLEKLTAEELDKLWTSCHLYTTESILAIIGPSSNSPNPDQQEVVSPHELISSVVTLARETLGLFPKQNDETIQTREVPAGLIRATSVLHDFLPSVSSSQGQIQNQIAKLCDEWYCQNLPEKDSVVSNALLYFLQQTLRVSKATKADVKRVYALKASLLTQNFQSASTKNLRQLLLSVAGSQLYLKCSEGIKFITFLFSLSPAFVGPLQASIKQTIPGLSKELSQAYGEIYHKAWMNSAGTFRDKIEEVCIQDMMYHGVLANRTLPKSRQIFEPLFHILEKFHQERNCRDTQALMERLWQPILWRYLKAANSHVRRNSTRFFLSAFPIENPNEELEIRAEKRAQQIEIMVQLLDDDTPEVRVTAIEGVSKVLSKFWLILSTQEINQLVEPMCKDLAFDASSPQVRQAVLRGFRLLVVDCPRSHLYLRDILPRLSNSLHDINESVRVAIMDLLLVIKKVKAIKFWDISSLEHLLARLAADKSQKIGLKIVQLLFPSFFPQDQNEEAKLERCIVMVRKNRLASRKFYQIVDKLSTIHNTVAFILGILVNLKRFVKFRLEEEKRSHQSVTEEDKENQRKVNHKRSAPSLESGGDKKENSYSLDSSINDHESSLRSESSSIQESRSVLDKGTFGEAFSDSTTVTALLDIVCIMWVSRSADIAKPENKEYRGLLEKKAAGILSILFKYYKSESVCQTVVYMASLLPQSSVSAVASFCLSRLKNATLPDGACSNMPTWAGNVSNEDKLFLDNDPIPTYVDSLCNWKKSDDLLEVIYNWIQKDVDQRHVQLDGPPPDSTRKRRGVRFNEASDLPRPKMSFVLLKYILRHPLNKSIVMKKNRTQIEELREILRAYIPIIGKFLNRVDSAEPDVESELILAHAWDSMLKINFLLHLYHLDDDKNDESVANDRDDNEFVNFIERLFVWGLEEAIEAVPRSSLARYIMTSLLQLTSNLVTLDLANGKFVMNAMEVSMRMLETGDGLWCVRVTSGFCKEVVKWSAVCDDPNVKIIYSLALPDLMRILISRLALVESVDRLVLNDVKKDLQIILFNYKTDFYGPFFAKDLLRPILQHVVRDLAQVIETTNQFKPYDSFKDLPFLSLFLVEVVTHKSSIFSEFLNEWKVSTLKSQLPSTLTDLAAQASFLRTTAKVVKTNSLMSAMKDILLALEAQFESLSSQSGDSFEDNQIEEAALEAIVEAKISLQMASV